MLRFDDRAAIGMRKENLSEEVLEDALGDFLPDGAVARNLKHESIFLEQSSYKCTIVRTVHIL